MRNEGVDSAHPFGNSYGTVSSLTALEQSINTAYVDMSNSLNHGSKDVYNMAVKSGIAFLKSSVSVMAAGPAFCRVLRIISSA